MEKASSTKEPLCKQKLHRKVLDKGLPEDVMPGILNIKVRSMYLYLVAEKCFVFEFRRVCHQYLSQVC